MKLTLCGSARFEAYWHEANKQLGLSGHICYALMTYPSVEGEKTWYTTEQKWTLDLAHLAKIEESDGVVMLNIDGYLGESSLRELEWARMRHKKVFWAMRDERMKTGETFARILCGGYVASGEWLELVRRVPRPASANEAPRCKHGWFVCKECGIGEPPAVPDAPRHDAVHRPSHYTSHPSGVECIEITRHMNFNRGSAVKYIWRAGKKGNEIEDLKKAAWYIADEIKRLKGETIAPLPVEYR